jgi:hypothetical protein
MIDLAQRSEPYEIELPYGLVVTVKPLTTAGMAAARRLVDAVERQARERTEAGLPPDGLPDLSAEGERDGFYQAQLIRELAARHITSWTGVELGGGPAPPTPENIAAVMESSTRWVRASSGSSRSAKCCSMPQKANSGSLPLALPAGRRDRTLPSLPRRWPALCPRRTRSRRAALSIPRARVDQPAGA